MSESAKVRRPIVMVVPDGAGDRPQPELDGLTPIEAAETPNLDALASLGRSGLLYPVGPGLAPSSHQAHFALFGYAEAEFPGRGLLEALGEGLPPAPGEVVLRANLARVSEREGVLWIEERPDPREGEAGPRPRLDSTSNTAACRRASCTPARSRACSSSTPPTGRRSRTS